MARNGSGTYNLPVNSWFPAVNGVTATSTDWNTTAQDIQAALTQSVSSDGQTPMTGNLAMGGNKITGLAVGSANTDVPNMTQLVRAVGQCRLSKSGNNLILTPFQGNLLTINGKLCTIPAAGVVLTPSGTIAGTTYYIYAVDNGSGVVGSLEASTTGHATDSTYGVEIKSGDPTRTLVGMARPVTGPVFQDSGQQRFVLSWFNRKPVFGAVTFGSSSSSNTLYFELSSAARIEFLSWGDMPVESKYSASVNNSGANNITYVATAIDSTGTISVPELSYQSYAATAGGAIASTWMLTVSEGYHYQTVLGKTSGGTATYSAFNHQLVIRA